MSDKMNIYEKLQIMRVKLQQKNIKKSGFNKFAGYHYYELADILPPINELQAEYKTCSIVNFGKEEAVLTIINTENPEEIITFVSPMAELALKGANAIQNIGGIETYSRRYLYMAAFEIVEADYFDAVQCKDEPKKQKPKKEAPKNTESKHNYRNELIEKLKEKHIDVNEFAKMHKLNATTSQETFKKIIEELG